MQQGQGITKLVGSGAGALGAIIGGLDEGGEIDGRPIVPGDSPVNDKVPAMLSPGEIVLPRSVATHPNAPELAKEFVKHLPKKAESKPIHPHDVHTVLKALSSIRKECNGGRMGYADGGDVDDDTQDMDATMPDSVVGSSVPDTSPAPIMPPDTSGTPPAPAPTSGGSISPDDRAALYQSLMEKRRSGKSLIGEGLAGLGDALVSQAGGSSDFLGKTMGKQKENEANAMGNFDTQRAMKMQNDTLDPTSSYSAGKQAAYAPVLKAQGYSDAQIKLIPGSAIDDAAKNSSNAQEFKARLEEMHNQNLFMNQFHKGELENTKAEVANTAQKNTAEAANQEKERRISALKDLPWYTGLEPDFLKSDKTKALESEAGIRPASGGSSSAPSVGSTFNGKKVLAVRKVK